MAGYGQHPVFGDEYVVRDQAVAAAGAHPGDEPGVLQGHVGGRDENHPLVDDIARLVGHGNAQPGPVGVQGARVVVPAAADLPSALDLAGGAGRGEDPGDLRVGVGAEHVVLRLFAEQAHRPGHDVGQGHDPGGAAVGFGDGGGHVEHGAHAGFVPAVALRDGDLEHAGVGEGLNALLGHSAVLLTLRGILADQRLELLDPGDELDGVGNLCVGGGFGGAGHR